MTDYDFNYPDMGAEKPKNDGATVNMEPASVGARFVAQLLDGVIVNLAASLPSACVGFFMGLTLGADATTQADVEALQLQAQLVGLVIGLIVGLVYYVYIPPRWDGKTVGKSAMNIHIVKADGSPVTHGTMFLRDFIGKFLSALIFMIGYIMAFFDDEKRALHDRIASTRVVKY
jgi:uncharacterized RDD family membrane protein YckC